MRLLENPLIKLIAIAAIIYFALFANKNNPDSLGNRLAPDKIRKNFSEAQEQSKFIISNVRTAQNYAKNQENYDEVVTVPELKISNKEIDVGSGEVEAGCGMNTSLLVSLSSIKGKNYFVKRQMNLIIGSQLNEVIETHIRGMKKGGVREIIIPLNYKSSNAELAKFLAESDSDLVYKVVLKDFLKNVPSTNLTCK